MSGRPRGLVFTFAIGVVFACHASQPTPAMREDVAHASSGGERIDAIARKCARIASCAHKHDAPRFRDPVACVEYWLDHAEDTEDPVPACLTTAASCGDVEGCLHGGGSARAAAFCMAHPDVATSCDGDALIVCAKDEPSESTLTQCAPGTTCGELHPAGGLIERACLSKGACAPGMTGTRCDGPGAVVSCHDQAEQRTACHAGTTCHPHADEDGEQMATCEGPAEASCAKPGDRSCRGTKLVRCEAHGHHGHEEATDCARLGLTCGTVSGHAECVAGPPSASSDECTGQATRCDREALVFCAAGRTERIPCRDLGLAPCGSEERGPVALCGTGTLRPPRH